MPGRNTVKEFDAPAYYHVYNRGAGGQAIFRDDTDRRKFMSILQRHLDGSDKSVDARGIGYEKHDIQLVAYCLMPNHFHLLMFQPSDPKVLSSFMRSVATAYTMYFNLRHKGSGHLFQGIYKASRITNEPYLAHISRYIHMNPKEYRAYLWSSLPEFLGARTSYWLHSELIQSMTPTTYEQFLKDYESEKDILEAIKERLGI